MNRMKYRPKLNSVLAFGFVFFMFALIGFHFDFYYDLNDDVLIKDIVSGAYTGKPDAHSIQMLYPISFFISLLYRLIPVLPWQGIFLCGVHGVCFYLIAKRTLTFLDKLVSKILLLLAEMILFFVLFLWELVMVQYTVTAALLAACACFLVFTSDKKEQVSEFLKEHITAIVLVILSFNIRSEMLLLMCPFIALTGIFKWSEEKNVFSKVNWKKYLSLIGIIIAGMLVSAIIDSFAYSGQDWKTFRDFFNARTKVYDYTWYPEYEEAEDFYRELGVTPIQYELIDNYNFGLDESIDAELLWSIADYVQGNEVKESLLSQLKRAVIDYKWRTFHDVDLPYNFLALTAYAMVLALAVVFRDKSVIWKLPMMVIFRSVSWMYVILANRVPARISHPLYGIEFIILCAWIISYLRQAKECEVRETEAENKECKGTLDKLCRRKYGRMRSLIFCVILLSVYGVIHLPTAWRNVEMETQRRESVNIPMNTLDAYAKEHPGNYYYIDVYSSVSFSEKMFSGVDNSQKNYDILGGWASGSPLQKKSTEKFMQKGLTRAELLLQDNFYFVMQEKYDPKFLYDFYKALGVETEIEEIDTLGEDDTLVIYRVFPFVDSMKE